MHSIHTRNANEIVLFWASRCTSWSGARESFSRETGPLFVHAFWTKLILRLDFRTSKYKDIFEKKSFVDLVSAKSECQTASASAFCAKLSS